MENRNEAKEIKSTEEAFKAEQKVKVASGWIASIGVFSLINSIVFLLFNGNINFLIGLGISQLIDDIGISFGDSGLWISILVNAILTIIFYLFAYNAKKQRRWAFILTIVIYILDSLFFIYVQDYIAFAFHLLAIHYIFQGLKAIKNKAKGILHEQKNNIQKNFLGQVESIENHLKNEELEDKGAFSNKFYKEQFYGKNYDENRSKASKFLKRHKQPILHVISLIIVLSGFVLFSLLDNFSISPSKNAEKYYKEGNYEKALEIYNKAILTNGKDFNLIYNKGTTLLSLERYAEAVEAFKLSEKLGNKDESLYLDLGYSYYCLNNFKESIASYKKVLDITPENVEAITWLAHNNIMLENYDEAINLCEKAIQIDEGYAFAYDTKGQVYYYNGNFKEALRFYSIAIEKDPSYTNAYVNKITALYMQKNYMEGMDFALDSYKLFPNESEIPYYLGDFYSAINDRETAIKYYEEALKLNEKNIELVARLGWEHFYNQDYQNAKIYSDKALELDDNNKSALSLIKAIKDEERPEAEKIVEFVKENSLYIDKVIDFDKKSKDFLSKTSIKNEDIKTFIQSIKISNDPFTFVFYDTNYDNFIKSQNTEGINSKMLDSKSLYIKINSFNPYVDRDFRTIIDNNENSDNLNLIIDLRDNGGGLAIQANNILDMLLPESTISYIINRQGSIADFYSGPSYTKFNKIIVMVNENSASSSELLALGLKKHLNNVTIIGTPTLGKGVGKVSYENKAKKYCIFLVSFYWNVKEKNIVGEKIYPDIRVSGSSFEDYLKVINEITK